MHVQKLLDVFHPHSKSDRYISTLFDCFLLIFLISLPLCPSFAAVFTAVPLPLILTPTSLLPCLDAATVLTSIVQLKGDSPNAARREDPSRVSGFTNRSGRETTQCATEGSIYKAGNMPWMGSNFRYFMFFFKDRYKIILLHIRSFLLIISHHRK